MAQDLTRSIKIYIDNSDAMANAQKLENKISSLRAELAKLSAEGKKNSSEYIASEKRLTNTQKGKEIILIKYVKQSVLKNLSDSHI